MDISKILSELKAERDQIEQAITSLERLTEGHAKKRRRTQKGSGRKDPPLEDSGIAVRVPRPKPNLPPANAAAAVPSSELTLAVSELKSGTDQIEEAITSLELLAHGRARKRGRPPAWMADVAPSKRGGRPPASTDSRLTALPCSPCCRPDCQPA